MEAKKEIGVVKRSDGFPKREKRLLLPHLPIQFDQQLSTERPDVEQFIAERFDRHYQAKINHFLPYLLSTKTDGKFAAAVGFHPADESELFLEQYLSTSIEAKIGRIAGKVVNRNTVVELGNLTSAHRGTSQLIFVVLAAILHEAGFEWTVFTATKQVQQLLSRLDLVPIKLCEADPKLLKENAASWGSYYQDKPNVVVGDLNSAIMILKQHPVTGFIIENYQQTIIEIASKLKR